MKTLILIAVLALSVTAGAGSKKEVARKIASVAVNSGLDPDLAVAIATVESGLNPKAIGGLGEVGLFQLRPEYHKVIKGNHDHNMLVGIAYLVELQGRYAKSYGQAWFVLFNYGPGNAPKYPERTVYYQKVMRELNRLKTKSYLALK